MSEQSKAARAAMQAKAKKMAGAGDPHQKVDASSWTPSDALNTTAKTGLRPVSRSGLKKGGKVGGAMAPKRADRVARKTGGVVKDFVNRNVKEANAEEFGRPHRGGLKNGGRANDKSKSVNGVGSVRLGNKANYDGGTRPTGGRIARREGGRAGKTNINIVIAPAAAAGQRPPQGSGPMLPPPAIASPPPAMSGGPGAGPMMPPPMAGGMPPPTMRKEGGRVGHRTYRSAKDMDAGGLSGMGRLEKTEIQRYKRT